MWCIQSACNSSLQNNLRNFNDIVIYLKLIVTLRLNLKEIKEISSRVVTYIFPTNLCLASLATDLSNHILSADEVLRCIDAFQNVVYVGTEEGFAALTLVVISDHFEHVTEGLIAVEACALIFVFFQILDVG